MSRFWWEENSGREEDQENYLVSFIGFVLYTLFMANLLIFGEIGIAVSCNLGVFILWILKRRNDSRPELTPEEINDLSLIKQAIHWVYQKLSDSKTYAWMMILIFTVQLIPVIAGIIFWIVIIRLWVIRVTDSATTQPIVPYQASFASPDVQSLAYDHALASISAVGLNPYQMQIAPIDIGLIVFDNQDANIHRVWHLDISTTAIQPFVDLWAKYQVRQLIRFEIYNDKNEMVFVFERYYRLKAGHNLITPPARLSVTTLEDKTGFWILKLFGDNLPLGQHSFQWRREEGQNLDIYVGSDGEISDDMRIMLAHARKGNMSLDELLNDAGDESAKKQGR